MSALGVTSGEALVESRPAGARCGGRRGEHGMRDWRWPRRLTRLLVDEFTHRATGSSAEEAEPAWTRRESREPVPVWLAVGARGRRLGVDVVHESRTALVGRERELEELTVVLEQVTAAREPRMVTVVGAPGSASPGWCGSFARRWSRVPELVRWRQGRCLPYGEGVSFWALAEIVKAEAGIRESDTADAAAEALAEMVRNAMPEARDAAWVETHLRRLVGLERPRPVRRPST